MTTGTVALNEVEMTIVAIAGGGFLTGALSVALWWRQRSRWRHDEATLRADVERRIDECRREAARITEQLEASERNMQANAELLRDGRLGTTARARALGLLRSGMSADSTAAELGLPGAEVRLLARVGSLLALRG